MVLHCYRVTKLNVLTIVGYSIASTLASQKSAQCSAVPLSFTGPREAESGAALRPSSELEPCGNIQPKQRPRDWARTLGFRPGLTTPHGCERAILLSPLRALL